MGSSAIDQAENAAPLTADVASIPAQPTGTDAGGRKPDGIIRGFDSAPLPEPPISFHPLAKQMLPVRSDEAVCELARHIAAGDVPLDPIIVFEGQILDRPELYLACLLTGQTPRIEPYTGNDPRSFLIERELHRGYLREPQRAMLGARACRRPVGVNQYSEGLSIDRASTLLNVSSKSIFRAKKVLARGVPELIEAVDEGTLSISNAERIAKLPEGEQRLELARMDAVHSTVQPGTEPGDVPGQSSDAQYKAADPNSVETETASDQSEAASEELLSSAGLEPASLEVASIGPATDSNNWIWPGYIPVPGVTAIVGSVNAPIVLVGIKVAATVIAGGRWPNDQWVNSTQVAWLTARARITASLHDQFMACADTTRDHDKDQFYRVHLLEAADDDLGMPIYHMADALGRLDQRLQTANEIRLVIADYLFPYIAFGNLEENIKCLRGAIQAMDQIAVKYGLAVVVSCPLVYRGGRTEITRAVGSFVDIPDLQSVLLVEGSDRGTISPAKTPACAHPPVVNFRRGKAPGFFEPSVPVILFDDANRNRN